MSNTRLTLSEFIRRARDVHGDQYMYTDSVYKNIDTKMTIRCPTHGDFEQTPYQHLRAKIPCPSCRNIQSSIRRTHTDEQFIASANIVHNHYYSYSNAVYQDSLTAVSIVCPDHGEFTQTPNKHLQGHGCVKCSRKVYDLDSFIRESTKTHGDTYDYSHTVYVNALTKVEIMCPSHGPFWQIPYSHYGGNGCGKCGSIKIGNASRSTFEDFVSKANIVHNYRYQYPAHNKYVNAHTHIDIECHTHGVFSQTPDAHIRGSGCPKCTHVISRPSNDWLNSLGIPDDPSHREVGGLITNRRYVVDGYDPETNTVYEFHGDYWHGNPEIYHPEDINPSTQTTYGQLYENTVTKKNDFISHGFDYIEMWESVWKL